jgi:hypothetical protein
MANLSLGCAALGVLLSACSGMPNIMVDTPTGVTPIYTQAAQPTGEPSLAAPPPGLGLPAPAATSPGQIANRSGTYSGTAVPLDTAMGACISTVKVTGFHVHDDRVHFGRWHGVIDAQNGLQMVYGQRWIVGEFDGATFHGQIDLPGRWGPGCTYALDLQRVSS